ncbi:hypothetical protein [Chromatium okenii]|uniref:hypothetical protein n=1 Tax=Chromatium okenii TaxID=61644 RepID=UPI001A93253E|nr:hypothetical protein [Chromatium okenii]
MTQNCAGREGDNGSRYRVAISSLHQYCICHTPDQQSKNSKLVGTKKPPIYRGRFRLDEVITPLKANKNTNDAAVSSVIADGDETVN